MMVDFVRKYPFQCVLIGVVLHVALLSCHARDTTTPESFDPGDHEFEMKVDGLKRTYRVHVPPRYSPDSPPGVVLAFHGGIGTGKVIQKHSRMDTVSDRHGFLAVYPDGLFRTWNAGECCEKAMRKNIDDVGFVSALIDKLDVDFGIDRRRVFATGLSNGAMLAHRLACELPDKIAAIAPVSGVIMVPRCKPTRPMSVMVFHGTADPRSLWHGGIGAKNPRKGSRESIPVTIERLATRYACPKSVETIYDKGDVRCTARRPCAGDNEVILCKIEGGGHQWPGGIPVWPKKLGPATRDIFASEAMWKFFERHPLPQ